MGIIKRSKSTSPRPQRAVTNRSSPLRHRRKSLLNLISPSEVTEGSLQVWLGLPSTIRQDPSLASFKIEHDRIHGHSASGDEDGGSIEEIEMNTNLEDESEFITINVPEGKRSTPPSEHAKQIEPPKLDPNDELTFGKTQRYKRYTKIGFLLIVWIVSAISLTTTHEKEIQPKQVVVPEKGVKNFILSELPSSNQFILRLAGPFSAEDYEQNETIDYLRVHVQIVTILDNSSDIIHVQKISDIWNVATVAPQSYEDSRSIQKRHSFEINALELLELEESPNKKLCLQMITDSNEPLSFQVYYDPSPVNIYTGTIYAAAVLIILYILIIWEIVHRTFAVVISSVVGIAILAALGDRPTMTEIVVWMDIETLLLLFSMMILVAILTETGVFDYLAVLTFEVTAGKIWPLIHCLCIVTCLISSVLDNVSTVLLMTPITIRLCEVMELNPVPVLMAIVVHANIGGTLTPIGDPPNLIITNNYYIAQSGVTFFTFVEHIVAGVILVVIQSLIHLRFVFRDINTLRLKEPKELKELRREISVWKRAADSLSLYSKDVDLVRETLLKKVKILKHKLKKKELAGTASTEAYRHTLEELRAAHPIKNKPLLIKSAFALAFIICLFFVQSIPEIHRLTLGWSALLGIILLLIIANRDDMDVLMSRIEWTTLLFFAAMFVTMESLERLGLIAWIGNQTENVILYVSKDYRLAMAIFMILWISAITSAFVDSIPVTAMMVKIVVSLAENSTLGIPLHPLVWAITFGPSLGGNGTLYGASANVVCAGIAEQHGYRFSFMDFFKLVFPMMIGSIVVITGYLMVAHVLFQWH